MKLLPLLLAMTSFVCVCDATLKRLRRSDYVMNYRLNHFELDPHYVMFPLGDFGTIGQRSEIFGKRDSSGSGVLGMEDLDEYSGEPGSCHMPDSERIPCGYQLNTSREDCQEFGCCYNQDGANFTTGVPVCYFHTVETTFFKRNVFVSNEHQTFCVKSNTTKFMVGRFNKAPQADMLCHHKDTGLVEVAHSTTDGGYGDPIVSWTSNVPFCKSTKHLYTGDLRGVYLDDLICLDSGSEEISTRLADRNQEEGFVTTGDTQTLANLCKGKIFVGDFDGDRLEDMLCVAGTRAEDGRYLARSDGMGTFLYPIRDPNYNSFCREEGAYIRMGNFDGDGRMDLLCVPEPGSLQIALTDGDGLLVNRDYQLPEPWCTDGVIYTGDFNGDNRYDLLCYVKATGEVCVRFNSNIFGTKHMFFQHYCEDTPFCAGGDLYVSDFNADSMDDIYCHTADGSTEVAESVIRASRVEFISVDFRYPPQGASGWFCRDRDNHVLDANADNRQDFLCHENKAGLIVLLYGDNEGHPRMALTDRWHPPTRQGDTFRFCYKNHEYSYVPHFLLADINGDGRKDMVCHYQEDGRLVWSPASPNGHYTTQKPLAQDFCQEPFSEVYSGDFNGDNYEDVMCQLPNGTRLLAFSDGFGSDSLTVDGEAEGPVFCTGIDVHLVVGAFDSMPGDDLFCHIRQTGEVEVMFADDKGRFSNVTKLAGIRSDWCTDSDVLPGIIRVADYDGDHRADLLCHYSNGTISVLYNQGADDSSPLFGGEFLLHMGFCANPGASLEVFDANGDGYADMTCHDSRGYLQIAEGHLVNRTSRVTID